MTIIYLRTNKINGMMYVGQTKNLQSREHAWKVKSTFYGNRILTADKVKYGTDNFAFDIITVCPNQLADLAERYYINKLNTQYPNGYNIQNGGKKGFTYIESDETRVKKSKSHKGKIPPCIQKKLQKIHQFTLDGEFVKEWENAHEIERTLGYKHGNINRCCNGGFIKNGKWVNINQSYGYVWKYVT